MNRAGALLAAFLVLLPLPLAAQTAGEASPERARVLEAFTRLVVNKARPFFGLPLDSFWRSQDGLSFALFATDAAQLEPVLQSAAAPFAAVSGQGITVVEATPLAAETSRVAALAPQADLVIVIAPRPRLAQLAAESGFNGGMLENFETGAWPFVFDFQKDGRRRGAVLLADDEPERAREASFILATVWGLGGVTLGPELTGLVGDSEEGPLLTPLGQAVFELFYDEGLEVGMPLPEALARAATLLPQ